MIDFLYFASVKFRNLLLCFIILSSCQSGPSVQEHQEFQIAGKSFLGRVVFRKLSSTTGFKVLLENQSGYVLDQAVFRYEPYRFDTADVNHDGNAEIIIGLTKVTRFDPTKKKRLFILQIDSVQLRPLWLGSKVCQELIDFRALKDGTIQTIERTKTGAFTIGHYSWQSFGLTLDKYTHQDISLNHANTILWN